VTGTGAEAASLGLRVLNAENENAQVASTAYCWKQDAAGVQVGELVKDALTTSASADVTVGKINVGDNVCCVAFDSSYYGDTQCKVIAAATDNMVLKVHGITSSLEVKLKKGTTESISSTGAMNQLNLTLGVDETASFDYFTIKNNKTNSAFNLKSIVFDLVATTNISKIQIAGLDESPTKIRSMQGTSEYRFDLPVAKMLSRYQEHTTGNVAVTANGNGCNGDTTELVNIYVKDEQKFKSVVSETIVSGIETDASTAANVGRTDPVDQLFYCL
jgi:hypothetical protein